MSKVLINGARGRMGRLVVQTMAVESDFTVVGETDHTEDLAATINATHPDIVLDFTTADAVFNNAMTIIEAKAHPVIGTSGLLPEQVKFLQQKAAAQQLGGIIAPNFSIGAILMMRLAKEASPYFEQVEIIELHHDRKHDSPSATAMKTAEMIQEADIHHTARPSQRENCPGARGAIHQNVHIHSIRLSGLVAHQEVIFGGKAETLTLRHDSTSRECFMPGVLLACRKVMALNTLVYGLENLI